MTRALIRQAIVTEVERARAAWTAYTLNVEYENAGFIDLAEQVNPYLLLDIVFMGGEQMDLGQAPNLQLDGQIMLSVGIKEGSGTQLASVLMDFVVPYLQLRDNLPNGVRTAAANDNQKPRRASGFYYLTTTIYFWQIEVKPVTP